MNYLAHYGRLIERARNRLLKGYRERHHVLPRCMGGGDEPSNLVNLTAEEHYVAHQLLVKMYPDVRGLATAAVRMARQCSSNKAYGWLRKRHSEYVRTHKHSQDVRDRISKSLAGRKKPPRTLEHRMAISNAKRANPLSESIRKCMGAAMRGQHHTPETKKQISLAISGIRRLPETRRKMAESKYGNRHAAGRKLSPEHIAKMTAARLASYATRKRT